MNMSWILGAFLFLGFLVFIAGVVIWAIKSSQREKTRRLEEASGVGLHPIDKTELKNVKILLADANPKFSKSNYELRFVFSKDTPNGDLYLYDLWDVGGEDSSEIQRQAFMLVTPYLTLPKFILMAKPHILQTADETKSILVGIVNKLFTLSMHHTFSMVDLSASPETNHKFVLAGEPPDQVANLFSPDVLNRFLHLENVSLAGGNHTLLYIHQQTYSSHSEHISSLSERMMQAESTLNQLLDALPHSK
jgi:hypothetical protein